MTIPTTTPYPMGRVRLRMPRPYNPRGSFVEFLQPGVAPRLDDKIYEPKILGTTTT
jgi:hypothetical protein